LELIFEVLTDMIQNPLFDKEELEREKGVIVEEINMYKDTPMYEIENVLEQKMWPSEPLGRDIAGTKDTVTKFTREMFLDYINRHYQAPNMILGISGKYNKKTFDSLVKKYWFKFPKQKFHGWDKSLDKQTSSRINLQFKETEQAHLAIGFKGLKYNDKRLAAQSVLSAILGGGMSSRLFMEVRERRGLGYYVRASGSSYQDTGVFNIGAGVQVVKIEEALKVIFQELEKIKNTPVEAEEIKKAKDYIKGKTTLALEDNQVRLDWFLERAAFYKDIKTPQQALEKIEKVTAKDIQNLAKDLFKKEQMTLAVIGPYKDNKKFEELINKNA
jgi:predicted Zn-dependent peptidase